MRRTVNSTAEAVAALERVVETLKSDDAYPYTRKYELEPVIAFLTNRSWPVSAGSR